jgi:hypothetical protein
MIVTSSMSVEYVRKMEVILMMIVTSSMSVEYVRKINIHFSGILNTRTTSLINQT